MSKKRILDPEGQAVAARLFERRRLLNQGRVLHDEAERRKIERVRKLVDPPSDLLTVDQTVPVDEVTARDLERILGSNEMVHVHFLERGVRATRAVGRISRRSPSGRNTGPEGTGSMVSRRLAVTNRHVLLDASTARRSFMDFDVEYDLQGEERTEIRVEFDVDTFFAVSPALDIAAVAIAEPAAGTFGWNPLVDQTGSLVLGDHMNVVQHPGGHHKQVAFRENRLLDVSADLLWYATDTQGGSSGSPVFNDQWDLVAIHRRGVGPTDEEGRLLNKDGTLHNADQDADDEVEWFANEGVRVPAIHAWLGSLDLPQEQQLLRDEVLAGVSVP